LPWAGAGAAGWAPGAAGCDAGALAGACLASEGSICRGARSPAAIAASRIESATKITAEIAVVRVRKSDAPRAVIRPAGLPPPASPPPSERCIRITVIITTATIVWRIRRKVNIDRTFGKGARAI
jgi:hypothetical protein